MNKKIQIKLIEQWRNSLIQFIEKNQNLNEKQIITKIEQKLTALENVIKGKATIKGTKKVI